MNRLAGQVDPAPWWQAGMAPGAHSRQLGDFTVTVRGPGKTGDSGAPHVFLVHGMVDASDTWAPLLPALAGCQVWHLDLPWSGRDGVDWPGQADALAWLQVALDMCGNRPGIFIGHSFGATVLLAWLATVPAAARLASMAILLAPFYCPRARKPGWDQIDQFARTVPQRFEHSLRLRMGADAPDGVLLAAMARKLAERAMPDALLELFRMFLASRRWPVARLSTPLQIIVGAEDGALANDSARALAAAAPHATLHVLPGCGHDPVHEVPDQLGALVAAMVAAIVRIPSHRPGAAA